VAEWRGKCLWPDRDDTFLADERGFGGDATGCTELDGETAARRQQGAECRTQDARIPQTVEAEIRPVGTGGVAGHPSAWRNDSY